MLWSGSSYSRSRERWQIWSSARQLTQLLSLAVDISCSHCGQVHLLLRAERWHHVILVPLGPVRWVYLKFVLLHEVLNIILIVYTLSFFSGTTVARWFDRNLIVVIQWVSTFFVLVIKLATYRRKLNRRTQFSISVYFILPEKHLLLHLSSF